MFWRIHENLAGRRTAELVQVVEAYGDVVQLLQGKTGPESLPLLDMRDQCALALTVIQDARLLKKVWAACPGVYFDIHRYDVSFWLPRIADDIPVLNRGALFCPFGAIRSIRAPLSSLLTLHPNDRSQSLFVRPDSGLKPFTGFSLEVWQAHSWLELARLIRHELRTPPELETMIVLAPGRTLSPVEWRFWIVDRKIVAWTPYTWGRKKPNDMEAPAAAMALAQKMAANWWQPDIAYVADMAQTEGPEGKFYLVELNAASTSGMYDVPFEPLVRALRDAAHRELAGDLAVED